MEEAQTTNDEQGTNSQHNVQSTVGTITQPTTLLYDYNGNSIASPGISYGSTPYYRITRPAVLTFPSFERLLALVAEEG